MTQGWTGNLYFGEVIKLLLAVGFVFELPVVILVLSALGIVTPRFLRTRGATRSLEARFWPA